MLIVDAANVIGSRPTGWWRDRAGAARDFTARVEGAVAEGALEGAVLLVLEGKARAGVPDGRGDVRIVHAAGSGDDTIAALAAEHRQDAVVVTADRGLSERVHRTGGRVVGPSWLLDRLPD